MKIWQIDKFILFINYFLSAILILNYLIINTRYNEQKYIKYGVKELDEDKLGKLVDLSGLGTVREVAVNFGGITQMRDEYFELQREIYK